MCFRILYLLQLGTSHGLFGGDERVVYWKCEAGQVLKENLTIPIINPAKEKALMLASQQVGGSCCQWGVLSRGGVCCQGGELSRGGACCQGLDLVVKEGCCQVVDLVVKGGGVLSMGGACCQGNGGCCRGRALLSEAVYTY